MNSIIVQFRITGDHALGLGSRDEYDFRYQHEMALDKLLLDNDCGQCDGGQIGAGTMEIFLTRVHDRNLDKAVKLVMDYLTDLELIGYCKIASRKYTGKSYKVHYPQGAKFDIWSWV